MSYFFKSKKCRCPLHGYHRYHALSRKRKLEESSESGSLRNPWDEEDSTSAILKEMGVAVLEDDDRDTCPEPTPQPYTTDHLNPPQAPRLPVIHPSGPTVIPHTTNLQTQSVFCTNDFLNKRQRTDVSDGIDHFNTLSDEMILCVFKWLPKTSLVRCARVCKRWKELTCDESLWKRLDLANKMLESGAAGRILDRGVIILRLTKAEISAPIYTPSLDSSMNGSQISGCKVQYLDLSMAVISTEGLEELLFSCTQLKKLSLENCQLNDNICHYIGQNKDIEVLNLCMCQGITENGLSAITSNLRRLEALNLGWTDLNRASVIHLVCCLTPGLLKLNISGCRETLCDNDLLQLCRTCPHLKELDLSDSTSLTSAAVEYIAANLRGLEYIALSRCYHIVPSSFTLLSNIFTMLALDVFGMMKETALNQLRELMPNIEINKFPFSSIARPTTGLRRTSLWGLRVRDCIV